MNYLLNIINYSFIFITTIAVIKIKKTPKYFYYALSVFLIFLLTNILLTNTSFLIHTYNPLNILLIVIPLSLLIPITINKKQLIFYISSLIPLDILIKTIISLFLDIPFLELNQTGYYYFSTYVLIINLFFKITFLLIMKLTSAYKNQKEIKFTILSYLIQLILEFIGFIIINYSLVKIIFINQIQYPTLIGINILYISLFILITSLNIALQKIATAKEKQINQYKEDLLIKEYTNIYIESQEQLFKLKHDMANIINSLTTYKDNIDTNQVVTSLNEKLINNKKIYFTDNKIINAILVNKINESKQLGITINTTINIQKEITISNSDIISLLTNLIDNSIEAVKYTNDKTIILEVIAVETLNITIKNAYNQNIKITKNDPHYHGFGIKIIKDIIKNNNGEYHNDKSNDYFFTHIILPLK